MTTVQIPDDIIRLVFSNGDTVQLDSKAMQKVFAEYVNEHAEVKFDLLNSENV